MPNEQPDIVALYGISKRWQLRPRSVLVEGTSDVALLELAADHYFRKHSKALLADMSIVAAGEGDRGGTHGVIRELVVLRGLAAAYLSPSGRPVYRVIGLFDSDAAGNKAVRGAREIDASIIEYRDVFRLRPVMPTAGILDPAALQRSFEKLNEPYKGIAWEIEDLIDEQLFDLFLEENPSAVTREETMAGKTHRELTRDGKSRLVRFCKEYADLPSLTGMVEVIHALRHYLNLPALN
ncbi:hypothetical protein [Zoogloea sp.]|uniref:hypothetical protein n=1 Tax=Zoogloea sp. TaxID=49181 RepID=UPI0035B07C21